ncbi:MAG: cytochrome c biogenesis protein CcsA [Planctomycetes bacterium]|nr:cytochrome c biogenesis protein CcsA [Planctomycetota bacterium]
MSAFFAERPLVLAILVAHGMALLLWTAGAVLKKKGLRVGAGVVFGVAFLLNTAVIAQRWIEAGRAPFKTLYETLLFYPWCVALVTLVLLALYRLGVLIPFASAACAGGLLYAASRPDVEIVNLPPALQSGWFVPHVVTYFVAYAALFASFALSLLALVRPAWKSEGGEAGFEEYAHRAVMFGFAALTMGLVMGAIWGKEAWGDYWSWDPKENWALVSWLAYLIYLHLRLVKGWRGRPALVVCLLAFVAVVFTYLGMSSLPSASDSLHVYQ